MADGLRLAEAGQADRRLALEPAEPRLEGRGLVEIDAGDLEPAGLEDQRLFQLRGRDWR